MGLADKHLSMLFLHLMWRHSEGFTQKASPTSQRCSQQSPYSLHEIIEMRNTGRGTHPRVLLLEVEDSRLMLLQVEDPRLVLPLDVDDTLLVLCTRRTHLGRGVMTVQRTSGEQYRL